MKYKLIPWKYYEGLRKRINNDEVDLDRIIVRTWNSKKYTFQQYVENFQKDNKPLNDEQILELESGIAYLVVPIRNTKYIVRYWRPDLISAALESFQRKKELEARLVDGI